MSHTLTENEKKFDRQLRLWGGHGQRSLESAHIGVLGSGATASESLKNLVLPNVGAFTIYDDVKLTKADLGANFFADQDRLGQPRAEVVRDQLIEMNDACSGNVILKDPATAINEDLESFAKYDFVIICQLYGKPVQKLAAFLYEKNIPMLILRANGLLGYVRVAVPEHTVVESHQTKDQADLFIHPDQLAIFPELKEYIDEFDLDSKDEAYFSHIPMIAILPKLLVKWKKDHGGKSPGGWNEKQEFKRFVKDSALDWGKNLNFAEAQGVAYKAYNTPPIDSEVTEILNDPITENLTADSSNFWVMAKAVKDFMANEGAGFLPCSSAIPDMTTHSSAYARLKRIFTAKAEKDTDAIAVRVEALLKKTGSATKVGRKHTESEKKEAQKKLEALVAAGKKAGDAEFDAAKSEYQALDFRDDIANFVKNVRGLRCTRYRSLAQELDVATASQSALEEALEPVWKEEPAEDAPPQPDQPLNIHWYFALRAADEFYEKHGKLPGQNDSDDKEKEVAELTATVKRLFSELGITEEIEETTLEEIFRFGGAEMHNIGAYLGGVAAQVVLKILTRQYTPLNNTHIYNGIFSSCDCWQL